MANQKLFEEAIAEAKAIREAAIANAKDALEESLTPHLKDMLAAKLQEMDSEEDLTEAKHEDEDLEEANHEEEMDEATDHEEEVDEAEVNEEEVNEAEDDAEESEDEADDEVEDEADTETSAEDAEEDLEIEDMEIEDLKNLIRDIIAQEMGREEEEEADLEDIEDLQDMEPMGDEMGDEEEIDLDELLAELESLTAELEEEEVTEGETSETISEEEDEMEGRRMKEMEEELKEANATINSLKTDLQEVNLLNSKLLYVNKIFKNNSLNEQQKVNVIAAFDKAETIKEVKLVYTTVVDSFSKEDSNRKPIKEHRSFASKATGSSTKPEVITEVNEQVLRMQKLAGIIN